jgi:hypothetical protein
MLDSDPQDERISAAPGVVTESVFIGYIVAMYRSTASGLPSCVLFLDVIEAVFGGMKQAVIHHSGYATEEEMKVAIARHFEERNEYFKENPSRAGTKILEIDFFRDQCH